MELEIKDILMPMITQIILKRPQNLLKFIKQYSENQLKKRIYKPRKLFHRAGISAASHKIIETLHSLSPFKEQTQQKQNIQTAVLKNQHDLIFLKNILSKNALFTKIKQKDLEIVINTIYIRRIYENQIILEQGQQCEIMFIVKQGIYQCFKNQKYVKSYKKGQVFEQIFIMYSCKSNYTIKSKGNGQLYCLKRRKFQYVIYQIQLNKKLNFDRILQQIPFLKVVSSNNKKILSQIICEQHFNRGQYIYQQNQKVNKFYIVIDGTVQIFDRKQSGAYKQYQIRNQGQYFGETSLFNFHHSSKYTVKCIKQCFLLSIYGSQFRRIFGSIQELQLKNARPSQKYNCHKLIFLQVSSLNLYKK